MIWLGVAVTVSSLVLSVGVARLLRLLPRLELQIAGLAVLSVGIPLAAVLLSGWVMFHMNTDLKILAVAAGSAVAAAVAGLLLARSVKEPMAALRIAASAITSGDFGARTQPSGSGELRTFAEAFNVMAASVEQLFDARRELVSWASHDLRTPLASLKAVIEAAEDGLIDPEEYLPTLRHGTETLSRLVDDLFELAQIDAGTLTLELRHTDVAELVEATLRLLDPEAAAHGILLTSTISPGETVVVAPDKIERVLTNLVANALRHTPVAGSVSVGVERRSGEVRVHVEDTGVGLEPGTQRQMFERFWRADRSRSSAGAGLGLAIARGLVEAHGGQIWAENREEGGARVSFSLPTAA